MKLRYQVALSDYEIHLEESAVATTVTVNGQDLVIEDFLVGQRYVEIAFDGRRRRFLYHHERGRIWIAGGGQQFEFVPTSETAERESLEEQGFNRELVSPMPGKILEMLADEGDEVEPDQALVLLEAMKMETTLRASAASRVVEVKVKKGDMVGPGDLLLVLEKRA
ncbi:MAG: biotin/lipoyl-containing protein [Candidatus Binatia bacterium]